MLLKIGQRPDHGFDRPLGLLSDCHRRIEHFLGTLATITSEVGGAQLSDAQRAQLEAAATYFAVAAPRHTADEEQSLFPRLRESQDAPGARAAHIVDRLERDHQAADEHHRAVDVLVRRWLSDDVLADAALDELTWRLAALQRMYESHIATEDQILFPIAGRVLSESQLQAIGREMATRRRPTAAV
jgi:iron-sulfur cluster repair protein YtfE (RIC family)